MRLTSLLALALLFANWSVYADQPISVSDSVKQIIAEFKDAKGVNSVVIQKGQGLGFVKAILKPKT